MCGPPSQRIARAVVLVRHALRNAPIPIITVLGLAAYMVVGTVIVETISLGQV